MKFTSQWGRAVIWTPIWIVIALFVFYTAGRYGPPYIDYYRVNQAFLKISQESTHLSSQDLRYELKTRMDSINPPFAFDEIQLTEEGNHVILDVAYDVEVRHPGMSPQILHFNPHVEFDRKVNN